MIQYFIQNRGGMTFLDLVFLVLTYGLLIVFVLPFHEFAHAFVAHLCGDDTAKWHGRMTLRPTAHLTLYGTLMLVLCGFGTARPVPVNPMNFRNRKAGSVLVSLAGPLSNLLLAIVSVGLFCVTVLAAQWGFEAAGRTYESYEVAQSVIKIASLVFMQILLPVNVSLAVFNMLPIPPLDGSRLWSTFLPLKWRVTMEQYSQYFIIALFALLLTGVLDYPLSWLTFTVRNGVLALFGLN